MIIYDYIAILIIAAAIFLLFGRKKKQQTVGAVGLGLTLFGMLLLSIFTQFSLQRNLLVVSGYLSFFFLAVVLLIGPLLCLSQKKFFAKIMPYRRDMGVLSFLFALIHVLSAYSNYFAWNFSIISAYLSAVGEVSLAVYAGVIAFIVLLAISLTSNKPVRKKLGTKKWKTIQRLSYIVAILIVLHVVSFGSVYKRFPGLQILFLGVTLIVVIFQIVGFVKKRTCIVNLDEEHS